MVANERQNPSTKQPVNFRTFPVVVSIILLQCPVQRVEINPLFSVAKKRC